MSQRPRFGALRNRALPALLLSILLGGDFVIAFSTNKTGGTTIADDDLSPLFEAVIEATEEAIYNSLLRATTVTGQRGATAAALPIEGLQKLLGDRGK